MSDENLYCDVCGARWSFGCGHTLEQMREARVHNASAEHLNGECLHFNHSACGPDCKHAGDSGCRPGFVTMMTHAQMAAKTAARPAETVRASGLPSRSAELMQALRGTYAARCETAEQAEAEVTRLIRGIDGFAPETTVVEVERMAPDADGNFGGWSAELDDPENEYEFETFTIFDDGDMDWT